MNDDKDEAMIDAKEVLCALGWSCTGIYGQQGELDVQCNAPLGNDCRWSAWRRFTPASSAVLRNSLTSKCFCACHRGL